MGSAFQMKTAAPGRPILKTTDELVSEAVAAEIAQERAACVCLVQTVGLPEGADADTIRAAIAAAIQARG